MRIPVLFAAIALSSAPAAAQSGTAATSRSGGLGSLGGLLGGGLPNVAGVGASNAAGLLGYCLKNNLLGGLAGQGTTAAPGATAGGAQSILQRLTQRQGVTSSPAYQAGQQGQVQAPGGRALPLDGLRGQVRNRMCGLVLDRARSFL